MKRVIKLWPGRRAIGGASQPSCAWHKYDTAQPARHARRQPARHALAAAHHAAEHTAARPDGGDRGRPWPGGWPWTCGGRARARVSERTRRTRRSSRRSRASARRSGCSAAARRPARGAPRREKRRCCSRRGPTPPRAAARDARAGHAVVVLSQRLALARVRARRRGAAPPGGGVAIRDGLSAGCARNCAPATAARTRRGGACPAPAAEHGEWSRQQRRMGELQKHRGAAGGRRHHRARPPSPRPAAGRAPRAARRRDARHRECRTIP